MADGTPIDPEGSSDSKVIAARRLGTGVDGRRDARHFTNGASASTAPSAPPTSSFATVGPAAQMFYVSRPTSSTVIRLLSARSRWMGYAKIEILPHAPLGRRPAGSIFLQVVITT